MIDKIGHIKNPLTIIAIFAGLAEISGTAILPFISTENQNIFVWFLILFPILLVSLFFLTLNLNHRVLYAPSDYKNEENFLKLFVKTNPKERVKRIKEEIKESLEINKICIPPEPLNASKSSDIPNSEITEKFEKEVNHTRNLQATYFLAEELILKKLSLELGIKIEREMTYIRDNENFDFDGVSAENNSLTVIEVKYMKTEKSSELSINRALENVQRLFFSLPNDKKKTFRFILALGTDMPKAEHALILNNVSDKIRGYLFDTEIKIYNIMELEKEFGLV